MKRNFLLSALLMTLITSCSPEYPGERQPISNIAGIPAKNPTNAANLGNPFDAYGRIFYEILSSYDGADTGQSLENIINEVDLVCSQNPDFNKIGSPLSVSPGQLNELINSAGKPVGQILSGVHVSPEARMLLTAFMDNLDDQPVSFPGVYSYVCDFEELINTHSSLTEQDRKVILTGCSIARYSAYYAVTDGEDKDWRIKTGIFGGFLGADEDNGLAIKLSASASVAINQ